MTFWFVVALIVVWMLLSAIILVSLCMASSRFNRGELRIQEDDRSAFDIPSQPVVPVSAS